MLAIQPSKQHQGKCTPNILPCRIHHTGPVNASKRYWDPVDSADKTYKIAYFRGRKLHGSTLRLPEGYKGVVVASGEKMLPSKNEEGNGDGDVGTDGEDEGEGEVKVLEEVAGFEELIVWGHEEIVDGSDPYVKGMEEWIAWSGCIHGDGSEEGK